MPVQPHHQNMMAPQKMGALPTGYSMMYQPQPQQVPMTAPGHGCEYYIVMPSQHPSAQMIPAGWPVHHPSYGGWPAGQMSGHPMQTPPGAQQMMPRMIPIQAMQPQPTHGADIRTGHQYAIRVKREGCSDIDAKSSDISPDAGSDQRMMTIPSQAQMSPIALRNYVAAYAAATANQQQQQQQQQHHHQQQQQQQQITQQRMVENSQRVDLQQPLSNGPSSTGVVIPAGMHQSQTTPPIGTPMIRQDLKCRIIERNGLKYHVCLTCNKEVIGRGDFNKHYRTHTNEKPYVCRADPNCKKRFGDASTRVRHERVHDMKRYECKHCKFLYTRKDNRDRHENKCTGGIRKRKYLAGNRMAQRIKTWNAETVSFDHVPITQSGASDKTTVEDKSLGSEADVASSHGDKAKKSSTEGDAKDAMSILLFAASRAPRASSPKKQQAEDAVTSDTKIKQSPEVQ